MQCSSNAVATQSLFFVHILLRCYVKGNIRMIIKIVNKRDAFHDLRDKKNTQRAVLLSFKGWYTYDVHENCPIFKTTQPLSIYVRNSSSPCTLNVKSQTNRPLSKWYDTCELTKLKQTQNQVTSHSKWPRVLLFDLAHKQCNGIIKGRLYCLTSELKGRFLANNILMLGSAWCLVMAQIQFSLMKKRLGDWTPKTLTTPTPHPLLRPITSHFCLTPPPPQSGRHKCITTTLQTFLPTILLKVALLYGCFSHGAKRHKVDIPQNKGKSRPSLEYYDIKKRQNTAKNYWFF